MKYLDTAKMGLVEKLRNGEYIICAEGYLFEFERRGYLKAGAFVPEVVVEYPDLVRQLHEEFVFNGSDVVEAFTYYSHREKLTLIGREHELEKFNTNALKIAREVADKTGTLMAGNICNTSAYKKDDKVAEEKCRAIFKEQIELAVKEKADFIIGETFGTFGESRIALESILQYAPGLPAVITVTPCTLGKTEEGYSFGEACSKLEGLGATVVGINCFRGPESMLPVVKEVRAKCKGPIACLPVPYRTTLEEPCMQNLNDQMTGKMSFPCDLDSWLCSRSHIASFTKQLMDIGVQYMGVCCGNRGGYIRSMAEALGRHPPASKYSPDMRQHISNVNKDATDYIQFHKSFGNNYVVPE